MQTVSSQPSNKRIAELAVLPVFFDLRGKRVVVIGGGEPAAWKIELLAAAGAQVDVYAEKVCEELSALAPTSIILHPRPWTPDDLEGAAWRTAKDIAHHHVHEDGQHHDRGHGRRHPGEQPRKPVEPQNCRLRHAGHEKLFGQNIGERFNAPRKI